MITTTLLLYVVPVVFCILLSGISCVYTSLIYKRIRKNKPIKTDLDENTEQEISCCIDHREEEWILPKELLTDSEEEWTTYQERFFKPRKSQHKSGFSIDTDTLTMLRNVIGDTKAKTTLTAYIENILLEHLKEHQALLNKTAAQYKRNQTLNL